MSLLSAAFTPVSSTPGRLEADERLVFQHFIKTAGMTVHHCLAALFDPEEICPERANNFAYWAPDHLKRFRFFSAHATTKSLRYIPQPAKVISFFRAPVERCVSLYDYWRTLPIGDNKESTSLAPRFVGSYSPRAFFILPEFERRQWFWNTYTCGLAGDPLISPRGELWRSETEILDCALQQLERLAFVGISEDMAGSMDALCRQLDVPNLYSGQFHNVTPRSGALECDPPRSPASYEVDDECLHAIMLANELDCVLYQRALELSQGDRNRTRSIRCTPGSKPGCHVRTGFADTWVENREGGFILLGPYMRLLPGRLAVTFHLRQRPGSPAPDHGSPLGYVDVAARQGTLIIARCDLKSAFGPDREMLQDLEFDVVHALRDAEFRVFAAPGVAFDVEWTVRLRHR